MSIGKFHFFCIHTARPIQWVNTDIQRYGKKEENHGILYQKVIGLDKNAGFVHKK